MKTRTVSVAVCGAVAGLLVGMAIFGIINPDAVSASALAYRVAITTQVLPRADALRRPEATTQGKDDFSTSSSYFRSSAPVAVQPVVDSEECTIARAMAAAFENSVDQNVPVNYVNLQMRTNLKAVGPFFINQYCPTQATHAAASGQGSSVVGTVDNNCEQYGERTTRRVICDTEQAGGRVYPKP
ncbi:MAG: hypothetical protein WCS85_04505 [Candidatus Peribacteraceae bacterium]|jgi:hypothetical protein